MSRFHRESGSLRCFGNFRRIFQFQDRMREVQLGTHTVRSHGLKVARTHMHDWLILMLLGVIVIILNIIHPFYRFVGKDMMTDLKYPMKSNTVPVWSVPLYAVLLPIFVFHGFYFRRRDVYDLHHGTLGLLYSILITAVLTDAIKDAVGRPRPDFFWRCFPDGKEVYDKTFGNVICHGKDSDIREGHKSFPSGHTSWSFAGLSFLSLYLCGKLKAFDRKGHVAKLGIVILPLLAAALVGVSRVDDYWHHWQDVFAGGLLGFTVSTFCYLQFFPPPYDTDGWGTYAYFRMLDETNSSQPTIAVNPLNMQAMEVQVVQQQPERNNHEHLGLSGPRDSTLDEMESGRSKASEKKNLGGDIAIIAEYLKAMIVAICEAYKLLAIRHVGILLTIERKPPIAGDLQPNSCTWKSSEKNN